MFSKDDNDFLYEDLILLDKEYELAKKSYLTHNLFILNENLGRYYLQCNNCQCLYSKLVGIKNILFKTILNETNTRQKFGKKDIMFLTCDEITIKNIIE